MTTNFEQTGLILLAVLCAFALGVVAHILLSRKTKPGTINAEDLRREVFENIIQGVAMFDRERNLVAWNKRWEDHLGFPPGFLRAGRPNHELIRHLAEKGALGEGDPEKIVAARLETVWSGKPSRSELRVHGERTFDTLIKPTKAGGLVITYTDITDMVDAQAKIAAQRDELDFLNQQKVKIFSIIAHDLKSPFNSLLGYAHLMTQKNAALDADKLLEFADNIRESAEVYFQLLEDLLTWGKESLADVEFSPSPRPISELIRSGVETMISVAERKDLKLSWSASELCVNADADMIVMVVRNLVGGAIKTSKSGGAIEVTADEQDDHIEVRVFNTAARPDGGGKDGWMTPESDDIGEGLGLTLCRDFVERHGGKVKVFRSQGLGTSFSFDLPKLDKPEKAVNQ